MKVKKLIPNFLWLHLVFLTAAGQPAAYSLQGVPEAIKNKASVVTHFRNIDLRVESIDKATLNVHELFTVLNEEGKDALVFNEYTSKFVSLEEAEIKVYDVNGRQTEKYKKKDMRTVATGEGLIEDGYVTYYRISASGGYPVTVEIKYEEKFKSTLFIPDFRFIHPEEGLVESNYTASIPADMKLRYKAKNTSIQPVITEEGKYKVYKWTVKNLAPIEYEKGAVVSSSKYPYVMIVTDKFSHYGFQGDLSSWKSFGTWIKELYDGLDVLPPDRQQFFSALVKDAPNVKEKIKLIYTYMQQNFRYVSIQLGIGGLKPFSAEFTDKKKYGDCKALSNYMKAALKSVGIPSYVAIINAEYNQEPVDPDFPANGFNHVILCVPFQKDSVWLECTSSTTAFNELGTFTENRNALLITDNGGVLVPTPRSHSWSNILSTRTTVTIDDDLSGTTETFFTTKGEFTDIINDIMKEKKDRQKEVIVFYFGFKQPDDFILTKNEVSEGHNATLKMGIAKLSEFSAGTKSFINPRMSKMWSGNLPKSENRKLDFYFHFPFEKRDTTIFKLPPGLKPDALPKEKESKCEYASFKSKYWYNDAENSIYSAATLILKQHKVLAADYASVKVFFDDIMQDDSQKIVVKKVETEKKAF